MPVPAPRDAERLVAAALLREPEFALDVFGRCDAGDFADALCLAVYRAARGLWDGWQPNGVWDVYRAMHRGGEFGGRLPGLLWDLYHLSPTAVNAAYHANLVRAAADRRRLRHRLAAAVTDLDDGRSAEDVRGELMAAG